MKKLWDKINGWKTYIGLGLHAIWFLANVLNKDLTDPVGNATGHGIIFSITGVGIGHKIEKNKDEINKQIKKLKDKITNENS